MNFKNFNGYHLYGYQTVVAIALSLFMTSLYAEVSVKNIEKNDKVVNSTLSAQNVLPEKNAINESKAWQLHAEQWELARSGESILSLPVLNKLVNSWLRDKQKRIEIQYPGGEEGELWVQELTDWLVSLGIPSSHMVIAPGSGADDVIKFDLIK